MSRLYGVTGVDILAGLHWYLKNWCGSHISWDKTGASQLLSVPKPGFLPRVSVDGVSIKRPIPWSYYQNAVTSSCKISKTIAQVCETKSIGQVRPLSCVLLAPNLRVFLQILLLGGTGRDGRRRLIGWLFRGSIYHSPLRGKRQFGRRFFG